MRLGKLFLAAALSASLLSGPAQAERIAIIGTGNVGEALGPAFAAQGHTIIYGSREPGREDVQALVAKTGNGASATALEAAVADADMIVLAVPGTAAVDIARSLGDLTGKIILDPTNVVGRTEEYLTYAVPGETSNAAMIQTAQPGATVVKAFNTLNVAQMVDPASAGGPITIPIAGNDAAAKAFVAGLAEGMGLEALDVGQLYYAHLLEEMLVMWGEARRHGNAFNYYLRRMPE